MKWQKKFTIGCQWIDMQHQRLVSHVDSFEQLVATGLEKKRLIETIEFLARYARDHFNDEEALMQKIDYPGLESQKLLHDEFINYVTQLLLDLNRGQDFDARELIEFLSDWITQHVLNEDMKIGDFIKEIKMNCDRNPSG